MPDRRQTLDTFRGRLDTLVRDRAGTRRAFAAEVGIDRSTLSQVLSPNNRRLPRLETLLAIARGCSVSVDWLLGLSADGPIRTEVVPEVMSLARSDLSDFDEQMIDWYRRAGGAKVRYIPATLPDLLKTTGVIRHEVRRYSTTRPEQKIEMAAAHLALARGAGTDVECCNSIQALEGFVRGEEIWGAFDERRRLEQLDHMIDLTEELYPTFRWFLYDARQRYAGAVTVFGLDRAVLYLGQMYLVVTAQEHVLAFVHQFDDLVKAAVVQPPDVPRLLRRLRSELAA